jgi:hypothetical protein
MAARDADRSDHDHERRRAAFAPTSITGGVVADEAMALFPPRTLGLGRVKAVPAVPPCRLGSEHPAFADHRDNAATFRRTKSAASAGSRSF